MAADLDDPHCQPTERQHAGQRAGQRNEADGSAPAPSLRHLTLRVHNQSSLWKLTVTSSSRRGMNTYSDTTCSRRDCRGSAAPASVRSSPVAEPSPGTKPWHRTKHRSPYEPSTRTRCRGCCYRWIRLRARNGQRRRLRAGADGAEHLPTLHDRYQRLDRLSWLIGLIWYSRGNPAWVLLGPVRAHHDCGRYRPGPAWRGHRRGHRRRRPTPAP